VGKGSRLKVGRKHNESSGTTRSAESEPLPRADLNLLLRAVEEVGAYFGTTPNCAAAAALLMETGRLLGYTLTPRPVSVLINYTPTDTWIAMGPLALAKMPRGVRENMEDFRPGGRDTGHLVLTNEDPQLLLDPNLRQLGSYGVPAPSIAMRISNPNDSTNWAVDRDGLRIAYMLDESNRSLMKNFAELVRAAAPRARELVRALRAS